MQCTKSNENVVVGYIPKIPFELFIFLFGKILFFRKIKFLGKVGVA